MDATRLQRYMHDRIPLCRAMAVEVVRVGPTGVVLKAPLEPNINIHDTVFGGSAAAVATLAAWAVVQANLDESEQAGRIVIRRSTMEFEKPIDDEFLAVSSPPDAGDWQRVLTALAASRMGRVQARAVLECRGRRVGELTGEFAILPGTKETT